MSQTIQFTGTREEFLAKAREMITDEHVERAAKSIAENHWSVDGSFMKAAHVSKTWQNHKDDARSAIDAALK